MPSALKNFLTGFQKSYGTSATEYQRQQNEIANNNRTYDRELSLLGARNQLAQQNETENNNRIYSRELGLLDARDKQKQAEKQQTDNTQSGYLQALISEKLSPDQSVGTQAKLSPESMRAYTDYQKSKIPPKPVAFELPQNYWSTNSNEHFAPKGYYVDNFNPKDKSIINVSGRPFKVLENVRKGKVNGADSYGNPRISLPTKGLYNNLFNSQQNILNLLNLSDQDLATIAPNDTRESLQQELKIQNKLYVNNVKKNMPNFAQQWYDKIYNNKKKGGSAGNPKPEIFWNNLVNDFLNNRLGSDKKESILNFEHLRELFKATYSFDPEQKYGMQKVPEQTEPQASNAAVNFYQNSQ